jgi:hypothetical protein
MYWDSRHGLHCCVSWDEFKVWKPAGHDMSRYLPASSPDSDRTQVPGIAPLLEEQFFPGVRSAQRPVPQTAPDGQLAHEITGSPLELAR